jgi:hypothetical protein
MEMHNSLSILATDNATMSLIGGKGVSSGGMGGRSANSKSTRSSKVG